MKHKKDQMGIFDMNFGWRFKKVTDQEERNSGGHNEIYNSTKAGMGDREKASDFDDSTWETIRLPHDWVTRNGFDQSADYDAGYKRRGKAWYRKKFKLPECDRDKQILIYFEGMSNEASIYVNGQLLYRNHSGYHSFWLDITDMANFGDVPNTIAIYIDASAREGWWYEGAGIYRTVWLLKKPAVHIAQNGCFVRTRMLEGASGRWEVIVTVEAESSRNESKSGKIVCCILDEQNVHVGRMEGDFNVRCYDKQTVKMIFQMENPKLWTPEEPYLYRMQVGMEYDGKRQDETLFEFGVRTVEFNSESGFLLNGKARKLKGFCCHQDHAGVGVAVPYAVKEYRIDKLKALGADAYRCAHNTDPEILEICDRKGMLVMEENRIFGSSEENLRILRNMVRVSRNHACVILYSLFNEEPLQGTQKGRRIAERMKHAVCSEDDTRAVTGAMNGGYLEPDSAVAVLDVVGINYNPAAYDKFHALFPEKPILGSETCSAYSVRGEYVTDMEQHKIDCFDENPALWGNSVREGWQMVAERPFVAGTFVWTGFDYRGEPTPFTWPSVASFFGTYDSCGFEKDACYFYKAFWKKEPIVHLVCDWESASEPDSRKVMVISNCDEIALYCNEQLVSRKKTDRYHPFTDVIPFQSGVLKAVGYIGGEMAASDEKWTSSEVADLLVEMSREEMYGDKYDAVLVQVALCDRQGHIVTNRDMEIEFRVFGGAELIGVGNGNPNSHEPDVTSKRRTFHGLVQAVFRNSSLDEVNISVSSGENLEKWVSIPVRAVEVMEEVEDVEEHILSGFRMYYQLFDEMPEPDLVVDENDMNRFEPVVFEGRFQAMLYQQYLKYALFRVEADIRNEKRLCIPQSRGRVWVYLGDLLLGAREEQEGWFEVLLPEGTQGRKEINIIVQNIDGEAGISSAVKLLC